MSHGETPSGSAALAAILPSNRIALATLRPWAWRRISDGLPAAPRPEPVRTRSGVASLCVDTAEGSLDLHNRFDPVSEAAALARHAGANGARDVVVFGFGAGYVLEAALAAAAPSARVVCAVIDPGAFVAALSCRDLSAALSDPRLLLSVGDLREIAANLPEAVDELSVIVHAPVLEAAAPALQPLADMARELEAAAISARQQRPLVLDNLARNLPAVLSAPHAGVLRQVCSGRAVLLVAPGPSLEQDLRQLARESRPLMVALDTSLRRLGSAGIRPDLAVTLDPTRGNLGKFTAQDPELPLVFFASARPEAVAAARHRFFACEAGGLLDRAHPWFGREGRVSSQGSVLLGALDLLLAAGAGPIALVGVDLALTDRRTHAGSEHQSGDTLRTVAARDGGVVQTTESLWRHRRRLLRRVAPLPFGQVIDATRHGAELPGLLRQRLETFLEEQTRDAASPERQRERVLQLTEVIDVAARDAAQAAATRSLLAQARDLVEDAEETLGASR
ncbi:MAG: 6-hydroxymethylpterin diphosphokinase MptE-like protein [Acidobacteriota bacterium]